MTVEDEAAPGRVTRARVGDREHRFDASVVDDQRVMVEDYPPDPPE